MVKVHDALPICTFTMYAQYIQELEKAQQKAARAGMPIIDATLIMIAAKAMLATQQFPTINNKLEDLGRSAKTWCKWKELYKKAEKQARVNRQAAGGQEQFGGAVLGAGAGGSAAPGRIVTSVTIDELEGCFYSLVMAATTGKKNVG